MAYTSIKRVLGETSLERKIRILFGVSLLALFAASFLSVNRITENQIIENTRSKASLDIENHLLRIHLQNIQLREDLPVQERLIQTALSELTKSRDFQSEILTLAPEGTRWLINARVVEDPAERELLQGLDEMFRPQQAYYDRTRDVPLEQVRETAPAEIPIDYRNRIFPDQFLADSWYAYYEPVIFNHNCIGCHYVTSRDPQAILVDSPELTAEQRQEFFRTVNSIPTMFVRVKLPYQIGKQSINRSRAILLTVAIGTAFLSMLALYLIVRYVIVKPLKHLRDVAEEVSDGRRDIRSDLATGDEFEELSRSFNKMLRHLLDAQRALQETNLDLDRKVDEQAALNLKLHEMNQVKSEFLANMSHELRTPLNSIIGFSEILGTSQRLEGKEQRYANNIHRSGRLLLDLINDILDLAKLEAGKMEVHPTHFAIQPMVAELCDIVRKLAEDKNIHLYAEVEPLLPEAYQDPTKLRQILINLLSNAIKFTPEGGRIRVAAYREPAARGEPELLCLEVEDTGIGIPEADRQVIFEKFRQGPTALGGNTLTREVAGTGLGLSIVRELCMLMGGTISVTSEVGKGSTFSVQLPWSLDSVRPAGTEVARALEEITKVPRIDFGRASQTPQPSAEELADRPAHSDSGSPHSESESSPPV